LINLNLAMVGGLSLGAILTLTTRIMNDINNSVLLVILETPQSSVEFVSVELKRDDMRLFSSGTLVCFSNIMGNVRIADVKLILLVSATIVRETGHDCSLIREKEKEKPKSLVRDVGLNERTIYQLYSMYCWDPPVLNVLARQTVLNVLPDGSLII